MCRAIAGSFCPLALATRSLARMSGVSWMPALAWILDPAAGICPPERDVLPVGLGIAFKDQHTGARLAGGKRGTATAGSRPDDQHIDFMFRLKSVVPLNRNR